jgi:hypothetical protein
MLSEILGVCNKAVNTMIGIRLKLFEAANAI